MYLTMHTTSPPLSGTRRGLGTFDTAEEAALMYDKWARQIRGPKAITNFPQNPVEVAVQ